MRIVLSLSFVFVLMERRSLTGSSSINLTSWITYAGTTKAQELAGKHSQNPILIIALRALQWQRFTIVYRDRLEEQVLLSWSRTSSFQTLMSFYGANVEMIDFRDLYSLIDETRNFDTSRLKMNFLCFLEPFQFFNLAVKIPNLLLHSWLIITSLSATEWQDGLGSILNFNSDVFLASFVASKTSDSHFYMVYEVYKIDHNHELSILGLCEVGLNGSLIGSNYLEYKYQRRRNLGNIQLTVVGLNISEFILKTKEETNGILVIQSGLLGELFLSIANEINISYSLQILKGYKFGAFKNGSWDGMIGHLSNNEVDMSVSEISMASDRLDYIGFTNSFMTVGRRIYIRRTPLERAINWQFFANPFSPYLLLSVVLSFVGMIGMLWIIIVFYRSQTGLDSIHGVSWLVICAFCQKGAPFIPDNRSGKIMFITTYFTFLIIYSSYSATLTSQLTFAPPIQLPFRDLKGLLDSIGWSGGPIKGDLTQIYMEKTCPEILSALPKGTNIPCELLVKLWTKVVSPKVDELPTSFQEGLAKVLKGRFAFVATSFGARHEINTGLSVENVCNIHELDGDHISSNLAFGLRKDFPFRGLINNKLLQLQQAGIVSRLKNFWLPQLSKDCDSMTDNFVQISISDFAFAPILIFFSIVLSCFMFALEKLFSTNITRSGSHFFE